MKYLIVIFFLFSGFSSFAQQSQGNDTSKYIWYKFQYGSKMDRYEAIKVLVGPKDTTFSKSGYAVKGTNFYIGNGIYWTLVNSSTQTNYNSIDSATTTGNEVCLWSLGIPFVCFTINSTPGDTTIAGVDSVIVQGNLLCQWKAGISTCYTISNTIINTTNNYITNLYTGVDSVVVSGTNLCQWSHGIPTCYTISTAPGDTTISGIDSVTIQGSQLCQWKAGVSICYTVLSTINNITNITNYLDTTTIIINPGSGIDSVRINGYQVCFYQHDSIVPRCWQLNTFFDDVRLSDDSTLYEFYNGDSLVKTVPSGIKNVGAVWPLSYDGVDLTTSKPFNDSLYLSSLVLHGTSLYSKKLTGDSVFVGIMGAGGSTGIDSMYVTTDSLYQVFIYHSGRRDSVVFSGSIGSSLSLTTTGTSGAATYSSSTGVLNVPQYTSSSGTVTSVATGYGLSGGTITTAGTLLLDSATLSLKYLRRADSTGNTGYAQIWKQNNALTTVTALNDSTLRFTTFGGTNYDATIVGSNYWSKLGNNVYRTSYNIGIGTSSPSARLTIRSDSLNNVIDTTGGISIQNKKAATSGVPQFPGPLIFEGQGYASTPATSMSARMILYNAISSSSSTPSQSFNIASSINNAAPTTIFQLNQNGNLILNGTLSTSFLSGGSISVTNTISSSYATSGAFANSSNVFSHSGTIGNSGTAGTVTNNMFYDAGTINTTGGTSVYRSFYSNISTTSATGATVLAYENTNYNNLLNTSSGATGVGVSSNASMSASAKLQIDATTAGFLQPRMTTTQRDAISSPATGLKIFNTTNGTSDTYNGVNWGEVIISSAGTLTLKHGSDYIFTGTTTTWTLPAVSSSTIGRQNGIFIKNRGSGAITLNSNAGSTLYNTAAQSTINIAAGAAVELLPDGTYFNVMFNL